MTKIIILVAIFLHVEVLVSVLSSSKWKYNLSVWAVQLGHKKQH